MVTSPLIWWEVRCLRRIFLTKHQLINSVDIAVCVVGLCLVAGCLLLWQQHLGWFSVQHFSEYIESKHALKSIVNIPAKYYQFWSTFGKVIAKTKGCRLNFNVQCACCSYSNNAEYQNVRDYVLFFV